MPLDHPKVLVEAILEQNAVAILILNKNGQIIFVNEAASQLAWKNPEHTRIDENSATESWERLAACARSERSKNSRQRGTDDPA